MSFGSWESFAKDDAESHVADWVADVLMRTADANVEPSKGRLPDQTPPAPPDWWEPNARQSRTKWRDRLARARIALSLELDEDGRVPQRGPRRDVAAARARAERHQATCTTCTPVVDEARIARHRRICPPCKNGRACVELAELIPTGKPCEEARRLFALASDTLDEGARADLIRRRYAGCEGGPWRTFGGELCLSLDGDRPLRDWRHCGDRLCTACARQRSSKNVNRIAEAMDPDTRKAWRQDALERLDEHRTGWSARLERRARARVDEHRRVCIGGCTARTLCDVGRRLNDVARERRKPCARCPDALCTVALNLIGRAAMLEEDVSTWAPMCLTLTLTDAPQRTAAAIGLVRRSLSRWRRQEQTAKHIRAALATVEVTHSTPQTRRARWQEHRDECSTCARGGELCERGGSLSELAERESSWWHAHAHVVVVAKPCADKRCLRCAFFGKFKGNAGVAQHRQALDGIVRDPRSKWRAIDVDEARARRLTRRGKAKMRRGELATDADLSRTAKTMARARRESWLDVAWLNEQWDRAVVDTYKRAPAELAELRRGLAAYKALTDEQYEAERATAEAKGCTVLALYTRGHRLDDLVPIVVEQKSAPVAMTGHVNMVRAYTRAGDDAMQKGDLRAALVEAAKYVSKPLDARHLDDDGVLDLMRAMRGRRMLTVYGIPVELDDDDDAFTCDVQETLVRVDAPPGSPLPLVVTLEQTEKTWTLPPRTFARAWALLASSDNARRTANLITRPLSRAALKGLPWYAPPPQSPKRKREPFATSHS